MIMKVESIAKQQASGFFHDYRVRPHLEMKRANIVRLGTIKMKRVCRIALDVFQDSINMNRVVKNVLNVQVVVNLIVHLIQAFRSEFLH